MNEKNPLIQELDMTKSNYTTKLIKQIVTHAEQQIIASGKPKKENKTYHDPGACPIFVFMPKKVQIIQMIIKALYDEAMPHPAWYL